MTKIRKIHFLYLLVALASILTIYITTKSLVDHDENSHDLKDHSTDALADNEDPHDEKMEVTFTREQLQKYDIQTVKLEKSHFQHRMTFPGQIALNENQITHINSSISGTVKELFKGLGETVKAGDALATLQSREMAEAKSAYISANKNLALNTELFERGEKLWKKKITPGIKYIQTRNIYENAKIELEQAKQKLLALGMTDEQIQKLPEQNSPLNIYTINSPINGKIIERHINLGEVITSDKQVFVIADLNTVWVNLAIPSENLPNIKTNQKVDIYAHQGELISSGVIMYVSPVINDESRTGRAIIQLDNSKQKLHPGDFIKAQVMANDKSGLLSLSSSAVQRIDGAAVVFVKSKEDTYQANPISIKGSESGDFIEILDGLNEGDEIVIKNAFYLKAELGKSEAEHSH